MKIKISFSFLIFALLVFSCTILKASLNEADKNMAVSFANPPLSARPGVFWCWLNGNMTKESITRDLEAMKSKGINRAEIWDVAAIRNPDFIPAGGAFLGDESVSLIKFALSEGKRLNMRIGIIGSSGWNAGGTWVAPDWASKNLFVSQVEVDGPQQIKMDLPFPEFPKNCPMKDKNTPVFYKDVSVLAVPSNSSKTIDNLNQVINISTKFKDGKLTWSVPKGKWSILRFVCSNNGQRLIVPSPKSGGLFIDFLDPDATRRHLRYFMDRLGITPQNSPDAGLAYLEFDSMELEKGVTWTDSMPAIFKERRGYSIENYLPVFAGWKVKDNQEKFLYDFKKTISDQLIFSHYATGTEFLKQYHADLVAESGGPGPPIWNTCPVDALKALGSVSIPRGEFWIKHRNMFLIKEIASASHIYGKKIVDAESFTTWRRWQDSPFEMKKFVDRAFCEGLNNITFHTFASTNPEDGLPGRAYHAGSDVNPGSTWWEKSKPFMDYLARCSYMLQQGLFVGDVCYYYGDQTPNFFPLFHDVPEKPVLKGLGKGYDYDVVNTDVILNRMSVKNGKIVLPDGMSYSVLLLPEQTNMPLEVLQKIKNLVRAGATVIGPKPTTVPDLNDCERKNATLGEIARELWGKIDKNVFENPYGKGKVIDGLTAEEVLQKKGIGKDFSFSGTSELDYIHRSTNMGEVYFLRNDKDVSVYGEGQFRITGKHPEIWDAGTGTILRVQNYTKGEGHIRFAIELPPHGSTFVVFSNENRTDLPIFVEDKKNRTEKEIKGPWVVNFPENWGAPAKTIFNNLISWTESEDKGIKYFSGTATYNNTFNINKDELGKDVRIDLGEVRDVAEVFVNGKSAGIVWKKPYVTDISKMVQSGENTLKIEVVNLWINRLTGDRLSDPKDRYCKTNMPYNKSDSFQPSGLLSSVKLQFSK